MGTFFLSDFFRTTISPNFNYFKCLKYSYRKNIISYELSDLPKQSFQWIWWPRFREKKRKTVENFEKSMIFGCFLTFLASIIIVESLKTIKHPKTVWIWRKNHFSNYFDKKNVPIKKTVTDAIFLSPDSGGRKRCTCGCAIGIRGDGFRLNQINQS